MSGLADTIKSYPELQSMSHLLFNSIGEKELAVVGVFLCWTQIVQERNYDFITSFALISLLPNVLKLGLDKEAYSDFIDETESVIYDMLGGFLNLRE